MSTELNEEESNLFIEELLETIKEAGYYEVILILTRPTPDGIMCSSFTAASPQLLLEVTDMLASKAIDLIKAMREREEVDSLN